MDRPPAYLLALSLLAGFRDLIDQAHDDLARSGHPGVRPAHGFAMQAIGSGAIAGEIAERLGVTKQAAAKTIARLEALGYVARAQNPNDARQKLVAPTARGRDMLALSAEAMERARTRWAETIGAERLAALETDLRSITGDAAYRLDLPGWSSD